MRARVLIVPDKIGSPAPRCAAPAGVVDPIRPAMTAAFHLSTRKETTMITLYDHIQELRAELRGCRFTRERAAVEAELAKAVADQAEVERAFDQALAALDRAA